MDDVMTAGGPGPEPAPNAGMAFPNGERPPTSEPEKASPQALGIDGSSPPRRRLRAFIIIVEVIFVLALLAIWVTSAAVRHSKSLWVLFFYCFPSQFVLAAVPHEPVILYFGKFYPAWTTALVATAGTLITEIINYSIFKYLADLRTFQRISAGRLVVRLVAVFRKAPFPTLWVAGLTPVPFYPFRFLVVLARYPLPLYALAVLLSRFPRFYILALIGNKFRLPDWLIIGLFLVLLALAVIPLLHDYLKPKPGSVLESGRAKWRLPVWRQKKGRNASSKR
ncbi:MAG: VTT domain-containing protein [Candidatus Aminicenantales bacterium]